MTQIPQLFSLISYPPDQNLTQSLPSFSPPPGDRDTRLTAIVIVIVSTSNLAILYTLSQFYHTSAWLDHDQRPVLRDL